MFDAIPDAAVNALTAAGLTAIRSFPETPFSGESTVICVSLTSVKLMSSGVGSYIGIGFEGLAPREMYGSSAEAVLRFEVYSPDADNADTVKTMCSTLLGMSSLTVTALEVGATEYDKQSGAFRCECNAKLRALLIRELTELGLSDYGLEGDGE